MVRAAEEKGAIEKKGDDSAVEKAPEKAPERKTSQLLFASPQSLTYLDGTLPGDVGFDPLGLSDPEGAGGFVSPEWLAYAEVIHGRWAMLGAAGILTPEILGKAGFIPESTGLAWFKSGVIPPQGQFEYWCSPQTLFFVEVMAMSFAEFRRLQDYRKPGSMGEQYFIGLEAALGGSGEPAYPGGQFFNLFNLGKDDMDTMKLREIKNGRLAMVSVLGFFIQALATGEGPVQNLLDHVNSGGAINFATSLANVGGGF